MRKITSTPTTSNKRQRYKEIEERNESGWEVTKLPFPASAFFCSRRGKSLAGGFDWSEG